MKIIHYLVPAVIGAVLGAIGLPIAFSSNRYRRAFSSYSSGDELMVLVLVGAVVGAISGIGFARRAETGQMDRWD